MSAPRRIAPEERRRGWCPGLVRPMPTGDGLLARVHPPLGILSAAQMRAVAEAARLFGNGHVDVTARANLQIRGVRDETAANLAAMLARAGLGDMRDDGGPQRLTLTSALAGLDPGELIDVPALAHAVETAGRSVAGLPPKTLVAIAGIGVAGAEADIVLRPREGSRVRVALAGGESVDVPERDCGAAVAALLRAFAASGCRRVRDLSPSARSTLLAMAGCDSRQAQYEQQETAFPELPAGLGALGGRTFLAVEAPFGRCPADGLDRLADAAERAGHRQVRLAPSRGFVLVFDDAEAARDAEQALAVCGFVTRPDDPRRAVAACPGAPACASGSTPVPEHAARLAQAFAGFAARGLRAHVSGCAKGCAQPGASDLTLVAEDGAYGIVTDGPPGTATATRLTFEAALERVRRADPALAPALAFRTDLR